MEPPFKVPRQLPLEPTSKEEEKEWWKKQQDKWLESTIERSETEKQQDKWFLEESKKEKPSPLLTFSNNAFNLPLSSAPTTIPSTQSFLRSQSALGIKFPQWNEMKEEDPSIFHLAQQVVDLAKLVTVDLEKGHPEAVYHKGMKALLRDRGILFESEVSVPLTTQGYTVTHALPDLIICNSADAKKRQSDGKIKKGNPVLVVELKAVRQAGSFDCWQIFQLRRYIQTLNVTWGILINFRQDPLIQPMTLDILLVKCD